jgi:hypothetical protein
VETVRRTPISQGIERSRWRLCDLRAALPWLTHATDAAVSRALKRLGVRLKRGRVRLQSPDPAYLIKLLWIGAAWMRALTEPERIALVFGDEVSVYRQPTLADRWFPVGEEPTATLSWRANTRWRISGGFDGATGAVTHTAAKVMGVTKLCQFLGDCGSGMVSGRSCWSGTTGRCIAIPTSWRVRASWVSTFSGYRRMRRGRIRSRSCGGGCDRR